MKPYGTLPLCFVMAALVFLGSCDKQLGNAGDGYRLVGTVLDSLSGLPIAGARLYICPHSWYPREYSFGCVITDSVGRYEFDGFPDTGPQATVFKFCKKGYKDKEIGGSKASNAQGGYRLNVRLCPEPSMHIDTLICASSCTPMTLDIWNLDDSCDGASGIAGGALRLVSCDGIPTVLVSKESWAAHREAKYRLTLRIGFPDVSENGMFFWGVVCNGLNYEEGRLGFEASFSSTEPLLPASFAKALEPCSGGACGRELRGTDRLVSHCREDVRERGWSQALYPRSHAGENNVSRGVITRKANAGSACRAHQADFDILVRRPVRGTTRCTEVD